MEGTAIALANTANQVVKSGVTYVAKIGTNKLISHTVDKAKSVASERLRNTSSSCNSIQNNSNLYSLDALSKAGQVPDRNGLTRAGRALDKHGGRPGSVFPKATGNPTSKNMQGQFYLDNILTDPKGFSKQNKFGGIDYFRPDGSGARFYKDRQFRGFLEPNL